jgi:NAD(P)H-nitrite reductase large subunit
MNRHLVCVCNEVTESEILIALKNGAQSIADIQNKTKASTRCGKCLATVNQILEEYRMQRPTDPQLRIDFSF